MNIPSAEIREFISKTFNDEDLEIFCYDYFREVQGNFTVGMTLATKIQLLISYCDRYQLQSNLMVGLQNAREELFLSKFDRPQSYLAKPVANRRDSRRIFISHAHQDSRIAHQLAKDLEANGWTCWVAPESINAGEKWAEAVQRGLEECGIFLLLLSGFAVESSWVKNETYAAIELENKGLSRVIPLDLQECEIPVLWRAYHRISFRGNYTDGWKALNRALSKNSTHEVTKESTFNLSITNDPDKLYVQLVQQQGEIEQAKQDLERKHLLEDALKARIAKLKEENEVLRYKLNNVLQTQSTNASKPPSKASPNFDDINDIFNEFFGGFSKTIPKASKTKLSTRGNDVNITVRLNKSEADLGIEKEVLISKEDICSKCSNSLPAKCRNCNGTGQVRKVRQSILGSYVNSVTCPTCDGDGEIVNCSFCHGKRRIQTQQRLLIPIPQKTQDGSTLKYVGYGNPGKDGGDAGDLLVKTEVRTSWLKKILFKS
jgi:hypothetical protein